MTPQGLKFIQQIKFDRVFQENQKDFFEYIDSEEPKLKYDVDSAAIQSIAALYDQDFMGIS